MTSLTAFAKERNVDPKAISIYLKRHKIDYDKSKGLTDEQIEMLDKVYPVPKPVIVVNGLDIDEERKLREELEQTQKKLSIALESLNSAKDKIVELTEKVADVQLLETKNDEQQKELERLKNRTFWERLVNK